MHSNENAMNLSEMQLVTFHLGSEEFGTNIMNVKEIVRISEITKVPNAPFYVEGVCNLRGNVLPIVDGRSRLNMIKKEKDENSRVLVIDVNGKATGIIVDRVSEVMRVNCSEIEPPPQVIKNIDTECISGVVKLNNGKRLIMLLEMTKILNLDENTSELVENQELQNHNTEESQGIDEQNKVDEQQIVTFVTGKEEYAIDIMLVKEIIRVPEIIEIPNSQSYIEGVVSLRNRILPILNLRSYFNMQQCEYNDYTRILIVDTGKLSIGILVDKVTGVMRIPKDIIQSPPEVFSSDDSEQIEGIIRLNEGKRLIIMLDPEKLISVDKLEGIREGDEAMYNGNTKSIERQMLDEEQLVTFKLDAEEYGIKISDVQEITRMTEVTKIPKAPYFIEGIVNLRGNIIPALDLRKLFGLSNVEKTDATRVIIVDIEGKKTGIIVDSVSEVLRFEKSLIEPPPDIINSGVKTEYIQGVGKLNNGNRMTLILDLNKVLNFNMAHA